MRAQSLEVKGSDSSRDARRAKLSVPVMQSILTPESWESSGSHQSLHASRPGLTETTATSLLMLQPRREVIWPGPLTSKPCLAPGLFARRARSTPKYARECGDEARSRVLLRSMRTKDLRVCFTCCPGTGQRATLRTGLRARTHRAFDSASHLRNEGRRATRARQASGGDGAPRAGRVCDTVARASPIPICQAPAQFDCRRVCRPGRVRCTSCIPIAPTAIAIASTCRHIARASFAGL